MLLRIRAIDFEFRKEQGLRGRQHTSALFGGLPPVRHPASISARRGAPREWGQIYCYGCSQTLTRDP